MKLYTKIINKDTKECLIINQIEAKKQGLQEMEIEFSYNGKAYLKGCIPEKSLEELKQEKIQELKEKRDEYKKTIFIKDKNLLELEDKSKYHFDNLILGLCGYTETDLKEYKTYISNISKTYDDYKLKINNATTKQELDKIIINF